MEPARSVHQEIIQLIKAVASNDEEFFPIRGTIKHTKQRCLGICLVVAGAHTTKGLVKLVEEKDCLLVYGLNVVSRCPG